MLYYKKRYLKFMVGGVGGVVALTIFVSASAPLGIIWVLNWVGFGSRG